MEITDLLKILRKYWLSILAVSVCGLALAAAQALLATPKYTASAQLFVSTRDATSVVELQQGSSFTNNRVSAYARLATTPSVLDPVIKQLHLSTSEPALAEQVTATTPDQTPMIEIDVVDDDPAQAAATANAVATSLSTVVQKLETPTGMSQSPVRVETVAQATAPSSPSSPNVSRNLTLGLILGLLVGVGIAILRERLDSRVRDPEVVQEQTGRPVVGVIPYDEGLGVSHDAMHASGVFRVSESFRMLRTNLQFLLTERGRSFVVTSGLRAEGKSTVSVNLAQVLAGAGTRVCLIDADMRKPSVCQYLGLDEPVGLSDVLIGRLDVNDAMHHPSEELAILPAGKTPPNPSELLASAHMRALLERLTGEYDVVLLDSPPVLEVTDAALLSTIAGGTLLCVAAGKTTRRGVDAALEALHTAGGEVSGLVLTMQRGRDAAGYGYGYGRSKDEAYGNLPAEPVTDAPLAAPVREAASGGSRAAARERSW